MHEENPLLAAFFHSQNSPATPDATQQPTSVEAPSAPQTGEAAPPPADPQAPLETPPSEALSASQTPPAPPSEARRSGRLAGLPPPGEEAAAYARARLAAMSGQAVDSAQIALLARGAAPSVLSFADTVPNPALETAAETPEAQQARMRIAAMSGFSPTPDVRGRSRQPLNDLPPSIEEQLQTSSPALAAFGSQLPMREWLVFLTSHASSYIRRVPDMPFVFVDDNLGPCVRWGDYADVLGVGNVSLWISRQSRHAQPIYWHARIYGGTQQQFLVTYLWEMREWIMRLCGDSEKELMQQLEVEHTHRDYFDRLKPRWPQPMSLWSNDRGVGRPKKGAAPRARKRVRGGVASQSPVAELGRVWGKRFGPR